MTRAFVLASAALLAVAAATTATAAPKRLAVAMAPAFQAGDVLGEVIAGPQRSQANRARDAARHPDETLNVWGLKPGAVIVELSPGGGYWTEILVPYAQRTGGRYVAVSGGDQAAFKTKHAALGAFETAPMTKDSGPYLPAGTADIVITARNIHSYMGAGTLDKVMADSFAALKPGGYLGVEEHRADPKPMKPDVTDGYVSEDYVIAAAEKAGFKLDARSDVNANPKDTKDHPFGVWTLPPTRRTAPSGQPADPSFDRTTYDAIGESDRMTLRFRKPG